MEFQTEINLPLYSLLFATYPQIGHLEKTMGQLSRDQAFIRLFISGFLSFSDGWVQWWYRPNVQQFAGRDGSFDTGKFPFLTFKLEKTKWGYRICFNIMRELSLKKIIRLILCIPDVCDSGRGNKLSFLPVYTLLSSVNWIHWSHINSVMAILMLIMVKYLANRGIFPRWIPPTTTIVDQFPLQLSLYKD